MAGTKVKTLDGDKNIEVWSCDAETGETGSKHVTRLSVNEARDIAHVTIGGETIDATTTHPFYVEGYGFKPAGQLLVGEKVRLLDGVDGETSGIGEVEAVTIEHLEEPVRVYNFEVEDWHTYYVAELGVLVHNQGCDTAVGDVSQTRKPINRPSSKKVKIDMEEVISGHTSGGQRAKQSQIKDLFPDRMNSNAIEKEIRRAYGNAKQVGSPQFDGVNTRILLQGKGKIVWLRCGSINSHRPLKLHIPYMERRLE